MSLTRLVERDDAPDMAALWQANRRFLRASGPRREETFYTVDGQREAIGQSLALFTQGRGVPRVVVEDDRIVGTVTLSSIIRGAFQSASLGYWLAEHAVGRGLMTRAVEEVVDLAFGELGLHRLQAEVMPSNGASRRVLERTGFVQYGRAPDYLCIDGRWEEHILLQRIAPTS